ncbi:hypothetical protein JRO89_XS01G0277700 [Xanthoceras sorbifolium]|uniref:Uncharacterized protein n=1 Tax=Xanthoceras sorbifolium TaxID=99658 RepID=A0ABQ8IM90_9ROSI|nr:hypothetical protein JRO89_XS01G0277700 [Xanthoceras sorbifolium]
MVYITSWDEFVERSVQLYKADPQSVDLIFYFDFNRELDGLYEANCVNVLEIMLPFPCANNVKARIIESNGCSLTLLRMRWCFLVFIMGTDMISMYLYLRNVNLAMRIDFGNSVCWLDFVQLEELWRRNYCRCLAHVHSSIRFEVLGVTLLPCGDANCHFVTVCLKFKTDQAQDAKKMEKLNNIFFALMARGPDALVPLSYVVDMSEITGKEQMEAQPSKKGRGRKQ